MTKDNTGTTDIEALNPVAVRTAMLQGHQAPGRIKLRIYRTEDSTHMYALLLFVRRRLG
jgi:hypothetical protein